MVTNDVVNILVVFAFLLGMALGAFWMNLYRDNKEGK